MIDQSESIKNLAVALMAAQKELGAIQENVTNPFLKNKYADLGQHINTIKPVFEKHGLVISQFVSGGQNEIGVTTMLMHDTGEWMKSSAEIPLEAEKGISKAQVAGKAISYLRRYALAAVANVYSGDDVDGQSEPAKKSAEDHMEDIGIQKQNGTKKKAKTTAEIVVELTDIDNIPHAVNWMNKMVESGVAITAKNCVELRENYLKEKETANG